MSRQCQRCNSKCSSRHKTPWRLRIIQPNTSVRRIQEDSLHPQTQIHPQEAPPRKENLQSRTTRSLSTNPSLENDHLKQIRIPIPSSLPHPGSTTTTTPQPRIPHRGDTTTTTTTTTQSHPRKIPSTPHVTAPPARPATIPFRRDIDPFLRRQYHKQRGIQQGI